MTDEAVSTYYRVLRQAGESRERRVQATHHAVKPEKAVTGPNQVWSWVSTKLHGPAKWAYGHLCDKRCYRRAGPARRRRHPLRAGRSRPGRPSQRPSRRPRTLRLQTAALLDLPVGSWINPPDQKEAATL